MLVTTYLYINRFFFAHHYKNYEYSMHKYRYIRRYILWYMDNMLNPFLVVLGGGVILSEGDAILEYLEQERDNYSNLILNESYITEEDRLVLESKLEVIQESITVGIIAAIIAIVGAIIAIIVKFIDMMGKGTTAVKDKVDKAKKEISKSDGSSDNDDNSNDKKTISKKEITAEIMKLGNEAIDNFKTGKSISGEWAKDVYARLQKEIDGSNLNKDDIKGLTVEDYSKLIKKDAFKQIENQLKSAGETRAAWGLTDKNTFVYTKQSGANVKLDSSDTLKKQVQYIAREIFGTAWIGEEDASKYFIDMYNNKADTTAEFAVNNVMTLLNNKIYDKAIDIQKHMNKDLLSLKNTLERLKNENYNTKDINVGKSNDHKDIAERRNKIEEFNKNMLYVEKELVSKAQKFMNTWAKIEKHRLNYCNFIAGAFPRNVRYAVSAYVNNKYKDYEKV